MPIQSDLLPEEVDDGRRKRDTEIRERRIRTRRGIVKYKKTELNCTLVVGFNQPPVPVVRKLCDSCVLL